MKPWDNIELTDEELQAAVTEGKKRKHFHEKHIDFWIAEEKKAIERKKEENERRKTK